VIDDVVDTFTCYSDNIIKHRSISFVFLAIIDIDYSINVGSGYFFGNVIKAVMDGKLLNIEGSGIDSTFIIANIYVNGNANLDNIYTLRSQTSLFYSDGSNSLSVKKVTIFISEGNKNRHIFLHESTGTFSVEDIGIKPINLFLQTTGTLSFDVGVFLLNDASSTIKNVVVESISLNNKAIFEFTTSFPSSFDFENNNFKNIGRTGSYGGSVLNLNVADGRTYTIKDCIVFIFIFLFF
jgi:hypothetical protein